MRAFPKGTSLKIYGMQFPVEDHVKLFQDSHPESNLFVVLKTQKALF